MSFSLLQDALESALQLYSSQGYVTFDDVISISERFNLSTSDTDKLSDDVMSKGVLILDEAPYNEIKKEKIPDLFEENQEEYDDYSQIDYDQVFKRVTEIEPNLKTFIEQVSRIKPPQYKELRLLLKHIAEGNEYAKTRMVEMHLRIAVRIALQRAEKYDLDLEDTIQDACIGLMTAVDRYNPEENGPFSSYASFWILQNVSREQSVWNSYIYYPVHIKEDIFYIYPLLRDMGCVGCDKSFQCGKLRKVIEDFFESDKSEDRIESIVRAIQKTESVEEQEELMLDGNCLKEYYEAIASEDISSVIALKNGLKRTIEYAFNKLSDKERRVLLLRFGFVNGMAMTLEEVGSELHVTRERIRQIEAKSLRRLRQPSMKKMLKDFLEEA